MFIYQLLNFGKLNVVETAMPMVDSKLELRHDGKFGVVGTAIHVVDAKLELR